MMHWTLRLARRAVVIVVGSTVVLLGVALLVLPGPGWLVIAFGLGIFAIEFVWARRLLRRVRQGLANAAARLTGAQSAPAADATDQALGAAAAAGAADEVEPPDEPSGVR